MTEHPGYFWPCATLWVLAVVVFAPIDAKLGRIADALERAYPAPITQQTIPTTKDP